MNKIHSHKKRLIKISVLLLICLITFTGIFPVSADAASRFEQIASVANKEHKALAKSDVSQIDISQYISDEKVPPLSPQEVESLLTSSLQFTRFVSAEDAMSDVELLFRAMKSAYCGYYYFGDANYQAAEASINAWIAEQGTTVSVPKLAIVMRSHLSFMRDAHAYIALPTESLNNFKYRYYYAANLNLKKDSKGYYKVYNGTRWYYKSADNKDVSVENRLLKSGKFTYTPTLFCAETKAKTCNVTLKNSKGKKKTVELIWTQANAYENQVEGPDFNFISKKGLTYISIRSFRLQDDYLEELNQFVDSGSAAKKSKAIILDIRSNSGGSEQFSLDFIKNLTGITPRLPRIGMLRGSSLGNEAELTDLSPGQWQTFYAPGKFIKNDILVIVLVDDACGSAGETMLNFAKSCENVVVVGSNSAGYQLSGNVFGLHLPHTGIPFCLATSFQFSYSENNVDGKGYAPDIWCNPSYALTATLNLLVRQGYTSENTAKGISDALEMESAS